MKRSHEPIVMIEDSKLDGKTYTHSAFGQISVSHISGSRVLYDSDYVSNSFVRITITKSELKHNLSRDWHFPREELITVDMSHAQWVAFVSSSGHGSGVPVTLDRVAGKRCGELPPRSMVEEFKGDMSDRLANAVAQMDEVLKQLKDDPKIPAKKREEISNKLLQARYDMSNNLDFVADSFDKHIEKGVNKAKAEIHSHMNMSLQRLGIESLKGKSGVLQIEPEGPPDGGQTATPPSATPPSTPNPFAVTPSRVHLSGYSMDGYLID